MSLIKKIASVLGKKDAPKAKQADSEQKPASTFKKTKRKKPQQEEWRPGGNKKPAQKKKTTQKKKYSQARVLTEEERRAQFRPEEEDRRIAWEQRLEQRKKEGGRSQKRSGQGKRKPRSEDNQPRPEAERKPRPKAERKPRPPRKPKPVVDDTPWDPSEFTVEPEEGKVRFHDLDLPPELMRGIHKLGWEYCTPIQAEILPGTLKGRDMAGRAQTGTGKTAAFLIAIINHCIKNPLPKQSAATPRALIIAPTRELAMQIAQDSEGLNRYTGLRTVVLYGGMDYNKQQRQLEEGKVDIVVATPGRLLDFENKHVVKLRSTETMVIDEADRMLDMGFIPDVRRIIYKTPPKEKRQTLLFSATLSDEVMRLAAAWMINPERIDIEPEQVAVDTVDQQVFIVTDAEKFPLLYNILKRHNPDRVIIFANRRDETERLCDALASYEFNCAMLSGAVTQKRRMKILEDFRAGKVKVLVATDVAGRGIHVEGVSHVINFNIPQNPDDYVHRIGRTGRAGATGISITFACEMESFELPAIEELLGESLKCTMPEAEMLERPPAPTRHIKRRPREDRVNPRRGGGGGRRGPRRSGPPRGSRGGRPPRSR